MKSEERHKLQTNELAEALSEMPDFIKKHGVSVIAVVVIVIGIVIGGYWWKGARQQAIQQERDLLQQAMRQADQARAQVLQQARMGGQDDQGGPAPMADYNPEVAISALGGLAKGNAKRPTTKTALLEQARLIRSRFTYSLRDFSPEQRRQIANSSQELYEKVLTLFPNDPMAVGEAKVGIALLAEDTGQWDKARSLYNEVASAKEGLLAGTVWPAIATRRLDELDTYQKPVAFVDRAPSPMGGEMEMNAEMLQSLAPQDGVDVEQQAAELLEQAEQQAEQQGENAAEEVEATVGQLDSAAEKESAGDAVNQAVETGADDVASE